MKKILIILSFIGLVSCEQNADPDIYQSESLTYFTQSTSGTYFVQSGDSEFRIQVGVTEASDTDRDITVRVVEEETDAAPESYSINTTSTIPAGEYLTDIVINGVFDEVVDGESVVIEIVDVEGSNTASFDNKFEVTLVQFCEYIQADLVGEWTLTSEFWGTESSTVNITAGEDEFTYVANIYGSLGIPNSQEITLIVEQTGPTNYVVNVAQQGAFDANTPIFTANYGLLSIAGSGTLDTCGVINLNLAFTVGAGSFGEYNEVLTKN